MYIPNKIKEIVKDLKYQEDNIGRSGDKVYIFEEKYILKISYNIISLKKEYEKNQWLAKFNISSIPIIYLEENNIGYYLRTYIKGDSLISKDILDNPKLLITYISQAVNKLRELDNKGCPFINSESIGNSFVHGDLCLPNILVNNQDIYFIDLDDAGLGDVWIDYSWLIWSFEYNLKTNIYTNDLLKSLNIVFDKEKYNKYIPLEYNLK